MTAAAEQPRARFSVGGCIVWVLAGIMFVVFLVALIPNIIASYAIPIPPALSQLLATPQTIYSTPVQQQPVGVPAQQQPAVDGPAPWPTLTPTEGSAPTVERPTATPIPTAFWNETEVAAFTATAAAFYEPETLPTAPPAFVQYTEEQCKDAENVKASFLLQQMCEGE